LFLLSAASSRRYASARISNLLTDTPVIGPPHWQIEAFRTFTIPEELAAQLPDEVQAS
jgi:hypothetical protein